MGDESGVVIELGPVRSALPDEPYAARPWSWRRLRPAALVLAAALTLVTGGAAPPAPPALTEVATIPLGPQPAFLLTADRIFTSTAPEGAPDQAVTAYDVRDGRLLWRTRYRAPAEDRPQVRPWLEAGPQLQHAPGLLLVTWMADAEGGTRMQTDGLDERTGELRWSVPYPVEPLDGGRSGLVTDETFPAGSEIPRWDPGRTPPDQVYFSQAGQAYRSPPDGARAHVIDLASGVERWVSSLVPRVQPIYSVDPMLLLWHEDGSTEVRDLRTGRLLHHIPDRTINMITTNDANDLLLVHSGVEALRLTAYSTRTWQPQWSRSLPDPELRVLSCGHLLCQHGPTTRVLDPATGNELWSLQSHGHLDPRAGHLVELNESRELVRTIDDTGRTRIDLTGWEATIEGVDGAPALLTRLTAAETWFGLLEPGTTALHVLGPVPHRTSLCQPGPGRHLACQSVDGRLRIWRYR